MIQNIKVCNIYAPDKEDYELLVTQFAKHPVYIVNEIPDSPNISIPSMIVGCLAFKEKYPDHNLFDKNTIENLLWTYSSKEKKRDFFIEINEFVIESMKKWLPSDLILYDPFFNGNFDAFIKDNLDLEKNIYAYFSLGALYLNNNDKNFVINMRGLFLTESNIKDKITSLLESGKFIIYSYNNISPIVNIEEPLKAKTLENICWIKFGTEIEEEIFFNIIPGYDIRKYIPFLMSNIPNIFLSDEEEKCLQRLQEKDFIVRWISKNYICFSPEFTQENLKIILQDNHKFASLNYSHKRTITGRIVCKDLYNVQNIVKEGEEKTKIISRFKNGIILVCDYVSFESKIALYKSEDEEFIKKYWNKDLHHETAKIIFNKIIIDENQRKIAKDINHAIIFGAGEDSLLKKLSDDKNPEETLYKIRLFLSPILNKAYKLNEIQKEKGYIINDWGYIINPKKDFAAFSNYIQSSAAEILVDKLFEIKNFLKNKESKFLFPVHDSMVFDISPYEKNLLKDIPQLLTIHNNNSFAVSAKFGPNYKNISNEKIY